MELPPELYRSYHQRRKADLERLKQAIIANDPEPFKMLGHQLKGNAPTYGYDELAVIGMEMETVETATLKDKGTRILDSFAKWIEDTEKTLQ